MQLLNTLRFIVNHPLNQKQKPQAVLRYFRWQLGSRLSPGEIAYDWVGGSRILLKAQEWGLTGNIYCGLHEYSDMSYLLHTMDESSLFVDIGANAGSYTILACGVRGARGYCFEPIPQTYRRLMANLRLNNLTERVKALNLGLAEEKGELRFIDNEDTTNHVLRPSESAEGAVTVDVLPLDEVLKDEEPSLMKIDVEGFETPVIQGALETLKKESLHSVIMELGGTGAQYGYDEKALFEQILSLGFRSYEYEPLERRLTDLNGKMGSADETHDNILFIRDLPRVQKLLRTTPQVSINGLHF